MSRTWHEVAVDLAGADGVLSLTDGAEWDANVVAEVGVPGGVFRSRGNDEEDAWRGVAHKLGDFRLVQALEAAGWTDIDEVIDQATYVVARDPDGVLWAIGVAAAESDRRGYIETDLESDRQNVDRIAFVEPIDTRDPGALVAALEAGS